MNTREDAPSRGDPPRFTLGQTTITLAALAVLANRDVLGALARHARGDWGDVDRHDSQVNDTALRHGARLMSVYHAGDGTKFYVITEGDRSFTTVFLPEDY